jgi:hypothetical protein
MVGRCRVDADTLIQRLAIFALGGGNAHEAPYDSAERSGAAAERVAKRFRLVESPTPAPGREQVMGSKPTPAFAAMVAEECGALLEALGSEGVRRIALERMEGCTDLEIATAIGCGLRTARQKLELLRTTWMREEAP